MLEFGGRRSETLATGLGSRRLTVRDDCAFEGDHRGASLERVFHFGSDDEAVVLSSQLVGKESVSESSRGSGEMASGQSRFRPPLCTILITHTASGWSS
jgi:hypothetical protein